MKYRNYNDNELISYVAESHEEARDILFKKYNPLIVATANKMYKTSKHSGLDINDLIQEGFLGLSNAIVHYDENKEASFYTFAKTCIERRMISLIISTKRLKHKILNESLSLDGSSDDPEKVGLALFLGDIKNDPEEVLCNKETREILVEKIKETLTPFEKEVFNLKIKNFDYKEIAQLLGKPTKSIDNALQRIKVKAKEKLKTENY